MNYLYITNDPEQVFQIAQQYAKDNNLLFYYFTANKETIRSILTLYKADDDCVIFIKNLNKSPVYDALLKVLEDNKKNIIMFATSDMDDIKEPVKARFKVINYKNKDIDKEVMAFMKTGKASKEIYSSIAFYICLAEHTTDLKTLLLINAILKQIKKCTYNIPWDYYFSVLKGGI